MKLQNNLRANLANLATINFQNYVSHSNILICESASYLVLRSSQFEKSLATCRKQRCYNNCGKLFSADRDFLLAPDCFFFPDLKDCKNKGNSSLEGDKKYANDLNEFYARFDCHDFENEMNDRFNFLYKKYGEKKRLKKYN